MVLEHVVAILLFSGPLLYIGLWMAIDPAGFVSLPEFVLRVSRKLVWGLGGLPSEETIEQVAISRSVKTALRLVGVALLVIAIVV